MTAKHSASKTELNQCVRMGFIKTDFAQREQSMGETILNSIIDRLAIANCISRIVFVDYLRLIFWINKAQCS